VKGKRTHVQRVHFQLRANRSVLVAHRVTNAMLMEPWSRVQLGFTVMAPRCVEFVKKEATLVLPVVFVLPAFQANTLSAVLVQKAMLAENVKAVIFVVKGKRTHVQSVHFQLRANRSVLVAHRVASVILMGPLLHVKQASTLTGPPSAKLVQRERILMQAVASVPSARAESMHFRLLVLNPMLVKYVRVEAIVSRERSNRVHMACTPLLGSPHVLVAHRVTNAMLMEPWSLVQLGFTVMAPRCVEFVKKEATLVLPVVSAQHAYLANTLWLESVLNPMLAKSVKVVMHVSKEEKNYAP
jgi:hypothetical protein